MSPHSQRRWTVHERVAENLADKGVVDAVVPAEHIPELVDEALSVLVDPPAAGSIPRWDGGARRPPPGTRSSGPGPKVARASGEPEGDTAEDLATAPAAEVGAALREGPA